MTDSRPVTKVSEMEQKGGPQCNSEIIVISLIKTVHITVAASPLF